ncbi:MAG: hypothetical protein J6Q30_06550 [Oscillospiraceae bacterium]|nr:hypothetical protein [Oscillospiraceae bacterium]
MKRFLCSLLCLLLCFSLFGCQKKETMPILEPVEFFYLQNTFSYTDAETIIGSEPREAAGHREDLPYLLELYFRGPQNDALAQPFPDGCNLVSSSTRNSKTITVVITDSFSTLTGMDLSIACVCLAKTVSGITGYPTVIIRTETKLLDGKRSITVRDGKPVLFDDYIAPTTTE